MPVLDFYAIAVKGTHMFLPAPRGARGGSWVEPTEASVICPPRLFHTRHAANCALTAWAKGRHVRHVIKADWSMDDGDEWVDIEPVPERKRELMEIVQVRMTI